MQILIPTYNRPETHHTARTLHEGGVEDWKYVVHNAQQLNAYLEKWPSDIPRNIVVSDVPLARGLGGQRHWIDEQIPMDEWYLQMDDNVQQFTKLDDDYYNLPKFKLEDRAEQDRLFNKVISPERFMNYVIPEMLEKCEETGAHLGGFAITKNSFFRGKKWTKIGFVVGKVLLLHRNGRAHFNPDLFTSDDYQITAEHLLRFGVICRNNYVYPDFPRYMPGGLGKLADRQVPYAIAAKQIMEIYPGAYNYSDRSDMNEGSSIKLRFTDRSEQSLDRWRKQLLNKQG